LNIDKLRQLDYSISLRLARSVNHHSPIRKFFQIATLSGTAFFWFVIIPLWYYFLNGEDEAITFGFVTIIMLIPVFLLKQSIRRSRPDFKDTRYGAVIFDEWSFPSGHATRSTYVVILMALYVPEFVILWILWALIMIISRLILGVHYISDIIAGILLSSIAMIIFYLIGWLPTIPWDIAKYLP